MGHDIFFFQSASFLKNGLKVEKLIDKGISQGTLQGLDYSLPEPLLQTGHMVKHFGILGPQDVHLCLFQVYFTYVASFIFDDTI